MNVPFQWAKACVTGAAHSACGLPCQDAVAIRVVPSLMPRPFFVAAVADGAGSALHGGRGARIAANAFADTVASEIAEAVRPDLGWIVTAAARQVHRVLGRQANRTGTTPDDWATTLLAAVTDGERTALLQVGDGAIVIGPRWQTAFRPERGEYANTTRFITNPGATGRMMLRLISGVPRTISLMTDGLEPLVVKPTSAVHPPLFEQLAGAFGQIRRRGHIAGLSRQLEGFLAGPDVQHVSGDDATLVTLHVAEGG